MEETVSAKEVHHGHADQVRVDLSSTPIRSPPIRLVGDQPSDGSARDPSGLHRGRSRADRSGKRRTTKVEAIILSGLL